MILGEIKENEKQTNKQRIKKTKDGKYLVLYISVLEEIYPCMG